MSGGYSSDAEKIDVRYVAHLARLYLSDDEAEIFQSQLEQVVGYVDDLKELDVSGVEPTAHAFPVQNVFREDKPRESMDREKALENAPAEHNGQFVVPRIIE